MLHVSPRVSPLNTVLDSSTTVNRPTYTSGHRDCQSSYKVNDREDGPLNLF